MNADTLDALGRIYMMAALDSFEASLGYPPVPPLSAPDEVQLAWWLGELAA